MRTIEEIKADMAKCERCNVLAAEAPCPLEDCLTCGNIPSYRISDFRLELFNTITHGIPIDRLEQLCNADRAGLCVALPCKVGDVVYAIGVEFTKCSAYGERFEESSCLGCESECDSEKKYKVFTTKATDLRWILERLPEWNKVYFTTRKSAEAALKEREADV